MSLGVDVNLAISTSEALYLLADSKYDLILSDISRGSNPNEGLEAIPQLKEQSECTPVIFYVGQVDAQRGIPTGSFAITDRADYLLHYVFDILERRENNSR